MNNKINLYKTIQRLAIFLSISLSTLSSGYAFDGGGSTGGGDEFALDFIQTATQQLYPWLKAHGKSLNPKIDADDFLMATNPEEIVSDLQVFETCDGSKNGREVEACYSESTNKIHLSRTRYPINLKSSPGKLGLVAHEIFRKMKLEGDQYEITRQISIVTGLSLPSANHLAESKGVQKRYSATSDQQCGMAPFGIGNSCTKEWRKKAEASAKQKAVEKCVKDGSRHCKAEGKIEETNQDSRGYRTVSLNATAIGIKPTSCILNYGDWNSEYLSIEVSNNVKIRCALSGDAKQEEKVYLCSDGEKLQKSGYNVIHTTLGVCEAL